MYIFNGIRGFGQAGAPLTDEQLGILGRCPNSQMPCRDFKTGEDLWQKVAFLDEGQKYTIGRCPNTQMPCMHPPGDPNGVDLWQLIKSKQQGPVVQGGEQTCQGAKPPSGPDHYYHCCPSGWTKTAYGDTQPCKGMDRGIEICGPLPSGATKEDAVCCENLKEWYPRVSGGDPCKQAAMASGKAVPNMPETMLAPDIVTAPASDSSNTTMLMAFGAVFVVLTAITLWFKFR